MPTRTAWGSVGREGSSGWRGDSPPQPDASDSARCRPSTGRNTPLPRRGPTLADLLPVVDGVVPIDDVDDDRDRPCEDAESGVGAPRVVAAEGSREALPARASAERVRLATPSLGAVGDGPLDAAPTPLNGVGGGSGKASTAVAVLSAHCQPKSSAAPIP